MVEIHKEMSELLDKQVNAQKECTKMKSWKPMKNCAMKKKKRLALKNNFIEGKDFIRLHASEDWLKRFRNEGTNTIVRSDSG